MLTTSYPFTDENNYTFDTDKIEISSGKAQLVLPEEEAVFTEDFADDTGFTYDSDLAEFSGGQVQQKNQRPTDAIFYASYTNNEDANWGEGTLDGTLGGNAVVSSGALDLTGGNAYCNYNIDNISTMIQTGTIRVRWKPNYSGVSPAQQIILETAQYNANKIRLEHNGTTITVTIVDKNGSNIIVMYYSFSATAGQIYELELNFDITGGITRLFIDGINVKSASGTGVRESSPLFKIGKDSGMNSYILDLLIFDTVQHTTNYTPDWSNIYETIYKESSAILPEMEHTGEGTLISFDEFETTESDSPRYTVQIGRSGNYLYWNGSAWVTSDGTYDQSNDATTFNANIDDLDVEGEIYGQFKIHFPDSNTQSSVSNLSATLTEHGDYATDNPTIKPIATILVEGLESFEATVDSGTIKYTVEVSGVEKYWNGSAWATSSGYSQSNTAAEINTNAASLDLTGGKRIRPIAYLNSDGQTQAYLDNITIGYNFYGDTPTSPDTCIVWGYVMEADTEIPTDTVVSVYTKSNCQLKEDKYTYSHKVNRVTVDSNGYFEIELIRSSEFANNNGKYTFEFEFATGAIRKFENITVPDEDNKNFWDLI